MKSIYLDNAATSYPKPPEIMDAFRDAATIGYGNAGRSSHKAALQASELLYKTRESIASLFGGDADRVVFTENATHALNLAIKSMTPPNSHLLLSDIEHNAVLRPVEALKEKGVTYSLFSAFSPRSHARDALLAALTAALKRNTVGVIACHRSNILPIELPLDVIGQFCKEHNLFLIVDASQSAGSAPIDCEACGITALAAPSHKGLYGLRGAGFALFSKNVAAEKLATLTEGGSGSDSKSPQMPLFLPERLEAGTRPIEILAALSAGVAFVKREGIKTIGDKERYLGNYLTARLMSEKKLRVYLPNASSHGIVLFNHQRHPASFVAKVLDEVGIALRDGLHCAPLAHRLSGTSDCGALRASFGFFNTERDADELVYALRHLP